MVHIFSKPTHASDDFIDTTRSMENIYERTNCKSKHSSQSGETGRLLTSIYLFVIFTGLPLVVHNGYFDIVETKFIFFLAASALYMSLILFFWLYDRSTILPFSQLQKLFVANVGILVFLFAYLLNSLFSGGSSSLLGQGARYQGTLTMLCYALLYGCLSHNFYFSRLSFCGLVTGFCFVSLLAMCNTFGFDPLNMARALPASQRWQFISTLGNVNFYSAYLGTLLPVLMTCWCFSKKRTYQFFSGIAILCGFIGMLPTGSESFMLALFTGFWILPLFMFSHPYALKRYCAALLVMTLVLSFFRFLSNTMPMIQYISLSMRTLTHPVTLLCITITCCTLLVFLHKKQTPLHWQRWYLFVSLALLIFGVTIVVLSNTLLKDVSFGTFDRFIKLNASWGTGRAEIWIYCLRFFRSFPLHSMLFGSGANCLALFDMQHPLYSSTAILDSAHNEYLQYLLAAGIIGLAGYVALITSTVVMALKRTKRSIFSCVCIVGILAYASQALVNIAQPISTPYMFLLLGMLAGYSHEPHGMESTLDFLFGASA